MKNGFKLSFGEEVGNAISHGVMAVLCLVLLPLVMAYMVQQKGLEIAIGVGYYFMFISFHALWIKSKIRFSKVRSYHDIICYCWHVYTNLFIIIG